DHAADNRRLAGREAQVRTTEGHDARVGGSPGRYGQPVRPQPGAQDRRRRAVGAVGVDEEGLPVLAPHRADRTAQGEGHALAAQPTFQRSGHGAEVNDPGARRVQRGEPAAPGLDVGDLAGPNPAQPRDAVDAAARFELRQPWQLIVAHSNDQFPAALVGDRVRVAELVHQPRALDAQPGLERARPVMHAAVDHAGVVAGLVVPDGGVLVDDEQARSGAAAQELAGHSQPDDPGAHHGKVVTGRVWTAGAGREWWI